VTLSQVFADVDVARAYRYRAPYPEETFAILESLVVEPRTVLDVGAGSGALAREMIRFAARVDAIDPSAAMVAAGRELPGGNDPNLQWVLGTAEEAPLTPPYGLIAAGASVHWMDAARVMPRFAAALAPGAKLAIVDINDGPHPLPSMIDIIKRYSEETHHRELPDVIRDLETSGHFVVEGERRTGAGVMHRSLDKYLEFLHSTSTLARVRLGDRATSFDAEVRALFAQHGMTTIEREYTAVVIWGRPVAA
jgi:SAM-dependent methyltransferase